MPSQSDERSCGRETDHNGSRVGGLRGQGEQWEAKGKVYGRVIGAERKYNRDR